MPKIRSMFVVVEDLYDKELGYQASLIYEHCEGVFPTNQFFGHDYQLAAEIAFEKNLALGLSREDQSSMIAYAMGMGKDEGYA